MLRSDTNQNKYYISNNTTAYQEYFGALDSNKHTINTQITGNNIVSTLDGTVVVNKAINYDIPSSLFLLARNINGFPYVTTAEHNFVGYLYSADIVMGNVQINLVPCIRLSDGEIGMYDLCGSSFIYDGTPFYGNSGTGTFRIGAIVEKDIDLGGYQQVEYLESSGTQWVDSGLPYKNGYKININFRTLANSPADQTILSTHNASNAAAYVYLGLNYGSSYMSYYLNLTASSAFIDVKNVIAANTDYSAIIDLGLSSQKVYVDGVEKYGATSTLTADARDHLNIFRQYRSGVSNALIRLKLLDIYDRNTTACLRVFIPVKNSSVIGLYDLISKQLFTNSGTGDFIAGPDVNP